MVVDVVRIDAKSSPAWVSVRLTQGGCVAQALEASGLIGETECLTELVVGIFSQPVTLQQPVQAGDRVEVYAPLSCNPQEARRRRLGQQ